MRQIRLVTVFLTALVGLMLASTLAAQGGKLVTIDMNAGSNTFPFGNPVQRHQMGISAANMQGIKGKITQLGFQFSGAIDMTWSSIEIYMGEANTTANAMSLTFDSNFGAKASQLVHNSDFKQVQPTPGQYYMQALDFPYDYSGSNTLVIEIRVSASGVGTGNPYLMATSGPPGGDGCRMYLNGSTTGATGAITTNWGAGTQFLIVQNSTWTGAASSDWNDPNNWDGEIPSTAFGAEIPNASTTPNDPQLPNGALIKELAIKQGGILLGGNGSIDLLENFINEGGTFIPGTSVINYVGTGDQEITTAGRTIGNVHIKNTSGDILIKDDFSALNFGSFTTDPKSNVYFEGTAISFSSADLINKGLFHFGLDGGGTVATLQSISTSGQNLGSVMVDVKDALDEVEFTGPVVFDNLTLQGAGIVSFLGAIQVTNSFTNVMTGTLNMAGLSSSADLNFAMDANVTITGAVTGRDLNHTGQGNLIFDGNVDLSGNANFISSGAQTTAVFNAAFSAEGNVLIDSAFAGPTEAVDFNAMARIGGEIEVRRSNASFYGVDKIVGTSKAPDVRISTSGNVDLRTSITGSTGNFGTVLLSGSGATIATGGINTSGLFLTDNSATFNAIRDLTAGGSIMANSTGLFRIGNELVFSNNSGDPQIVTTGAVPIEAGRMRVIGGANLNLQGKITMDKGGYLRDNWLWSVEVDNFSGLTMSAGSQLLLDGLSANGNSGVRIQGAFLTNGGASSQTPRIRSTVAQTKFLADNASRVNFEGLVLDGFSPTTGTLGQNFAMTIRASASVLSFNDVSIINCNANDGAVNLGSSNVPLVFKGFACDGTTPVNFDATAVSGVRIEVKEASPTSGNRYGVPFEIDPNGVLYWQNPPVVDVISTPVLPNALAENLYSFQLSAVGGNQPLTWSIANNPGFLNIIPTTGELIGFPGRDDIGTHVFVVLASDGSNPNLTSNKIMTLVVDSLTTVGVTIVSPVTLLNGMVGESYRYALAAAGGTGGGFTWTLVNPNALPKGLFLSSKTGEIFGVPDQSAAGVYNVAVRVEDARGNSAVKAFGITVHTKYSNPAVIAGSLSDGSGGCALGAQQSAWFLLILAVLAVFGWRRRQEA